MPKVSVIVPLYKVEDYMDKCINSLVSQTLEDIEIILVDDGSPDSCGDRAEVLAKIDKRIRVIHKENGGLSSARNAGLEIATGEYVAFVDSDDWVELDMMETMYNNAIHNHADLMVCNYRQVQETKSESHDEQQNLTSYLQVKDEIIVLDQIGLSGYFYQYLFPYIHGYEVWNKMYKNEILQKNGIRFEKNVEIFSEDLNFNLYVLCHTHTISTTQTAFYNYLQRGNSLMAAPRPKLSMQYCNLVEKYVAYVHKVGRASELDHVIPILFYKLFSTALFTAYHSTYKEENMIKSIKNVSDTRILKSTMRKIATGKTVDIYCERSGKGRQTNIRMRMFAALIILRQYKVLDKLLSSRWSKTEPNSLNPASI